MIGVATALTLGACRRNRPSPPAPVSSELGNWTPIPAPPPAPSGPLRPVQGLDLCGKTDLTRLADMKVKVDKKNLVLVDAKGAVRKDVPNADAECSFKMRTRSGRDALMLVTINTLVSVEEAKFMLQALRRSSQEGRGNGMNPEGSLSGVGEEADGFSLETDKKAYQEAQYLIRARFENRVVEVSLGVFGKPFIPKATLAEQVRTVLQATAALASQFEQGEVPGTKRPHE